MGAPVFAITPAERNWHVRKDKERKQKKTPSGVPVVPLKEKQ